ncbi:MAG: FG-GAP repeat domain-containing protein [Candidatus Udaeobacter sp.]
MKKRRGAQPAIALFVFGLAYAMTFGEVSAQVATFTTQQYPLLGNSHIAADLNADGRPDLAGAGANAVSVMLGNGDGTFRPKNDFPIGTQTQAVAAGDFNSDGRIDLVVTLDSPQFSLALLTGTGTGSFNAPTFFPNTSGFDSPAIAATDLNGDGKLDLVVMHTIACFTAPCRAARSITILLGNGDGTFQTPSEIDVATGPMAMAVLDLNRDGIKDVAIGGGNTELSILLGVGNGTFTRQPVVTLVPGGDLFSACNDIGVGDLNRDGIQDLVVPLGNGNGNAILVGNGNGTFQVRSRIQIDETSAPLHVAVADYNRDGLLDIARTMGEGTNGLMQILRGNGDGTFQAPNRYLVPPPSRGGIMILAGDWNGDAKPDIAFVEGGAGTPTIDVLTNTTAGVPPPTPTPPPSLGVASLSLNPTTVTGGNSSTGTVTLTAIAQAATTVVLASNNAAAIVPASVTVPAGSQSRTFSISTTQVSVTTSAVITASLNGTSRSATLTINPAAGGADSVSITRAEYAVGNRRLRVEATSTRSTATLQVFVTSSNQLIGTLSNDGGGRYRGDFAWPVNPQSITVRSNFGGQATRTVTAR